ncbi:MAG: cardiolipin synthase [Clostridia bacterium]|nr:cardiolipin synthase [Clostridia bacterium]
MDGEEGTMEEQIREESEGLSLIKKGKKGLLTAVFSRLGIIVLLFVVQLLVLIAAVRWFTRFLPHLLGLSVLIDALMVPIILNSRLDPTAKITWLMVILVMPIFGPLLYAYTRSDIGHRALRERIRQMTVQNQRRIRQEPQVLRELEKENPGAAALTRYMRRSGCYPAFDRTDVTYFPLGEEKFAAMLEELEKAQRFIFLEYFIVDEGVMWGRVLEILARKAKAGVEVRMMYDGTNEFSTLPHDYPKKLRKLGIQCRVFAPLTPFLSTHYNYRDHRKILVIDGHTAFTGGVNLADNYINRRIKYGHWKDTAVMIKGEAVRSFTLMFLQMWHIRDLKAAHVQYERYLSAPTLANKQARGFVIPYGDCPLDEDKLGERVYLDILNHARHYVHIMTPYLILDSEMENALCYAAQRGVDVRIIMPGVPDKEMPYALAKTYYPALMDAGVRIYEYTPGFVHAKIFVADDDTAVVGTINLDYRSLYHHFECAAYMYKTDCIADIEKDFHNTLRFCQRMTPERLKMEPLRRRILGPALKVIAPLL